jgi:hypothetical protein
MDFMPLQWKLETRNIKEVVPNDKNPRKISKKATKDLETSIRKFGLCQPIVLNRDGKILGGHQRVRALETLGYTTIDVIIPHKNLTKKEEDELTIRLNKNMGIWDIDLLANHWEPKELCEWGFSMEELGIESIPDQQEQPKKFAISIDCIDQDQLDLIEKHIANIVNDFSGAKYKVKVK